MNDLSPIAPDAPRPCDRLGRVRAELKLARAARDRARATDNLDIAVLHWETFDGHIDAVIGQIEALEDEGVLIRLQVALAPAAEG